MLLLKDDEWAIIFLPLKMYLMIRYYFLIISIGSLLGSLAVIPVLLFLNEAKWKLVLAVFVVVMIWLKHHQNISRLLQGTEKSWRSKE